MDGIVAARMNACTAHELQDAGIVKSALRAHARGRHCGGHACMDGIVAARINACTAHELQDDGIVKSALRAHALQAKHRRMHNRLNRSRK